MQWGERQLPESDPSCESCKGTAARKRTCEEISPANPEGERPRVFFSDDVLRRNRYIRSEELFEPSSILLLSRCLEACQVIVFEAFRQTLENAA